MLINIIQAPRRDTTKPDTIIQTWETVEFPSITMQHTIRTWECTKLVLTISWLTIHTQRLDRLPQAITIITMQIDNMCKTKAVSKLEETQ